MKTILYARVSTTEQTIGHQKTQAEAQGFVIDLVVEDNGVSGVTAKLKDRVGGKRLYDILRAGDTLLVRWVDRLGRDYQDVSDNIREFMRLGIVVRTVINGMTFDGSTKDPMQQAVRDALIGFMAALSQAQAEATKEAQRAGIAHAKANGSREGGKAYRGRQPSYTREQVEQALVMKGEGKGVSDVAKVLGLTRQTIYRITNDPAEAMSAVEKWAFDRSTA